MTAVLKKVGSFFKHKKTHKVLKLVFVYTVLAFLYLPLVVLIVFSFTEARAIGSWDGFSLGLYFDVFTDPEILGVIGNTFLIAVVSASLATVIGTVSAVGIFYLRKAARTAAQTLNQITVINADIVTGVAFMLFFISVRIIPQGYATIILAHTIVTIPYVVLAVLPRLSQLNPNLYEAGMDLGAGPMRTLVTVIFPQLIPSMISGFALAFTLSLDDFVITKFTNGDEINTISTYIFNKLSKGGLQSVLRAVSSLVFIVSLLILIGINVYSKKRAKRAFFVGR